jgi:phosphoribosylaminoimidazole-succinocarboxamide synthase
MRNKGLFQTNISELGNPIRGKVRDNWVLDKDKLRLIITTDRQSIYGRYVGLVPEKGKISNLTSNYWFEKTKHIVKNHLIASPHPNITLAHNSKKRIPIEIVVRRFIAKGKSSTSIYENYFNKGRREIYGIKFPNGLKPNQELPMGTIITPTTKAEDGLDEELTDEEACKIVDSKLGKGVWQRIKEKSLRIFELARKDCLDKGLILADTKFEFGIDFEGNLMLIDEVLTPECSRYWLKETYKRKFENRESPDLSKEILSEWLMNKGFTEGGDEDIKLDLDITKKLMNVYFKQYEMITQQKLSDSNEDSKTIKKVALDLVKKHI